MTCPALSLSKILVCLVLLFAGCGDHSSRKELRAADSGADDGEVDAAPGSDGSVAHGELDDGGDAASPGGMNGGADAAGDGGAGDAGMDGITMNGKADAGTMCAPDTQLVPGVCGNNVREPGEACDDGDTTDGNGCSARCLSESPSDDVFSAGHPLHGHVEQVPQMAAFSDTNEHGSFRIKCDLSHVSHDDPIVYPCMADAAHFHSFFGNPIVDARKIRPADLLAATGSTCQGGPLNRTAYWVPTLLRPVYQKDGSGAFARDTGGNPVRALGSDGKPKLAIVFPSSAFVIDQNGKAIPDANGKPMSNFNRGPDIYYKRNTIGNVHALPAGLRMIAGSAGAQAPQPLSVIQWICQDTTVVTRVEDYSSAIPRCTPNPSPTAPPYTVRLHVFFPSCWDGVHLDVPDHKSHMAYSVGNYPNPGQSCPATHPVALPQVSYHIDYPLWPETLGPDGDSREWFLASDHYAVTSSQPGGYSAHGDWFMAWDPQVMATWVQNCINEERHCANGDLGNGFRLASLVPGVGNTSTAPIAASVP